MKSLKIIILSVLSLIILVALLFVYGNLINPKSPRQKITYTKGKTEWKLSYSRPYKKGRLIFGELEDNAVVPYAKYWRLGANQATRFQVNNTFGFAGRPMEAGDYRMYAIPFETYWTVVLHNKPKGWGYAVPDPQDDIIRVNIPVTDLAESVEQLTLDFKEKEHTPLLRIRWDQKQVIIPLN